MKTRVNVSTLFRPYKSCLGPQQMTKAQSLGCTEIYDNHSNQMLSNVIKCYCTYVPVFLLDRYYLLTNNYCTVFTPLSSLSPPVLGLGHMLALRVEALVRVGGVVDHLELAVLVVVAVAAMHHTVGVSLLVPELPVVPGTETRYK